jgi:ABC-type multidrug transport system fused ATPase/permease subunit
MQDSWRSLLRPIARAAWLYLGLIALRELVRLGGNYSMSATFRFLDFSKAHDGPWIWLAFLGGLALYFEIGLRINGAALWHMTTRINAPLYKHMRLAALRKFLSLPVAWHQRHNSAVLVAEVNSGVDRVQEIVDATGWELLPLVVATVLSIGPLIWFSPLSALIIAAAGAIFILLNYRIYLKTEPYRTARCDCQREDWKLSTEYVRGLPAVLMANHSARARREYEEVQDRLAFNTVEEYRYEVFRHGRWRDRVIAWTHVALIGVWLHQLRAQSLTMVDCIYLWRICEDLLVYMEGYSAFFEQVVSNTESVRRYLHFLQEPAPPEDSRRDAPPAGAIRIDLLDVSFRYQEESRCLDNISESFAPGEIVAIVGATGSGKSTLAKLLCALLEPSRGDILFNGHSVRDWWSPSQVRSLVSYVPQLNEVNIFARSIADNIRFAAPHASIEQVIEAAILAGIHDEVMNLPDGYDTVVGESGCTLSGGQIQRLAIARELLKDAPVLILDEPASAQDVLTESRIFEAILPRLAHKTVILISHRMNPVRSLAGRVLLLEDGRVVESGSPDALLRARGRYFQMVEKASAETLSGNLSDCVS